MKRLYYSICIVLTLSSCQKTVLKIENVPENTPQGAPIYVTGNFNRWDPGDTRYQMQKLPDNSYLIQLPQTIGRIEYKFTRGNWSTIETNRCGNDIENHFFMGNSHDTIFHDIECWIDLEPLHCDSINIVVERIPENTPKSDTIRIAGSFNAWNPGNKKEYLLKLDPSTKKYVVKVPRKSWKAGGSNILTYKFVRKDINFSEADKFGGEMDPRVLDFSKGDSVLVSIDNWSDLVDPSLNFVTIILKAIPSSTPANAQIFLTGNFNDWNPFDKRFKFQKNNSGIYQITIPRQKYGLSFKITRGSWNTEFTGECGRGLDNQVYNYDEIDTVFFTIAGWKDIPYKISPEVVLVIDSFPENTPPNDILYLDAYEFFAGTKLVGYPFQKMGNRTHQLKIKRKKLNNEYVITRGSHATQEVTKNWQFVKPRRFENDCQDTLFLKVANWNDSNSGFEKMITVIVDYFPKTVGKKESIYMVGQFNGWDPRDDTFIFTTDDSGNQAIRIPYRYLRNGFKLTMGSWNKVEGDLKGNFIENRTYLGNEKVLHLRFENFEKR